jgi:hypothetical protein
VPLQPTREQQCEQGSIAFSFQALTIWSLPKRMALLCRQPAPEPHAQLLHPFNPANAGRQVGAEKSAVGRFVCESAHITKTQIDCARCELTGFEMRTIAQNHYPVERQARFRAIPVNELLNGMTIAPLCICGV